MNNIDTKFIEWFYHEVYAEPNHNRNGWMSQYADMTKHYCRDWWMRQAFKAGYARAQLDEQHGLDQWMESLEKDLNE